MKHSDVVNIIYLGLLVVINFFFVNNLLLIRIGIFYIIYQLVVIQFFSKIKINSLLIFVLFNIITVALLDLGISVLDASVVSTGYLICIRSVAPSFDEDRDQRILLFTAIILIIFLEKITILNLVVSAASIVWYTKIGLHFFFMIFDKFYLQIFKKLDYNSGLLLFLSIDILLGYAKAMEKFKNIIILRILILFGLWFLLVYVDHIISIFVIHSILNILLIINTIYIFVLNRFSLITEVYDEVTFEYIKEIASDLNLLSYLEKEKEASSRAARWGYFLYEYHNLMSSFNLKIFNDYRLDQFLEDPAVGFLKKQLQFIENDIGIIKTEYIKKLIYKEEKMLFDQLYGSMLDKKVLNYEVYDSTHLLVMRSPVWYININKTLINSIII